MLNPYSFDQNLADYAFLRAQITKDRKVAHDARNVITSYTGYTELNDKSDAIKGRICTLAMELCYFIYTGELIRLNNIACGNHEFVI